MNSSRILIGGLVGLATLTVALGCGGSTTPKVAKETPKTDTKAGKSAKHDHGEGPHGGTVADWGGGKYHVEFTVDHPKQEATVYILGEDEKTSEPISAKEDQIKLTIKEPAFEVMLKAVPQESDPKGKSSRFVGKHEKLGKVQEFAGTISGEVSGRPYVGDFKEEPEKK